MGVFTRIRRGAELFTGVLMGLMFLTFIIQILVRYSARLPWIAETLPFLDPNNFGWTLEFCLLLWIWIIFAGGAFVVTRQDHVTFDLLYDAARPQVRRWLLVVGAAVIAVALALTILPTLEKFSILRLKKTATLSGLFGDWIRMRHIYAVYILFLVVVSLRSVRTVWQVLRNKDEHSS